MKGWRRSDRKAVAALVMLYGIFAVYIGVTKARTAKTETLVQTDSLQTHLSAKRSDSVCPSPSGATPADTGMLLTERYPGPPVAQSWLPKLKPGATLDLNTADTLLLRRLPGIGPSYARRIVRYRDRLGGFYCREQVQEVFGMSRGKYDSIAPYLEVRTRPHQLVITPDSIPTHPYLSFAQRDALREILGRDSLLTWKAMQQSGKFRRDDSLRLVSYLSFE